MKNNKIEKDKYIKFFESIILRLQSELGLNKIPNYNHDNYYLCQINTGIANIHFEIFIETENNVLCVELHSEMHNNNGIDKLSTKETNRFNINILKPVFEQLFDKEVVMSDRGSVWCQIGIQKGFDILDKTIEDFAIGSMAKMYNNLMPILEKRKNDFRNN